MIHSKVQDTLQNDEGNFLTILDCWLLTNEPAPCSSSLISQTFNHTTR